MEQNCPRRRGLVLQGGGAKGAFQYGALQQLRLKGIDFDVIAGTSVGALNGAIAATESWDQGDLLWSNLTMTKVFKWMTLSAVYTVLSLPGIFYFGWATNQFDVIIPKPLGNLFVLIAILPTLAMLSGLNLILRSETFTIRTVCFLWTAALVLASVYGMRKGQSLPRLATSVGLAPPLCFCIAFMCLHPTEVVRFVKEAPWLSVAAALVSLSPLLIIIGWVHRMTNRGVLSNLPLREVIETVTNRHFSKPLLATTSVLVPGYVDPDDYEYTRVGRSRIFEPDQRSGFLPKYNRVDESSRDEAVEMLLSSAALPLGIVPNARSKMRAERVVDGGLADNLPWFPLIDSVPCSEIVVILCEPRSEAHSLTIESWRNADRKMRVLTEAHKVPNFVPQRPWDTPPEMIVKKNPPKVVPLRDPECWSNSQPVTFTVIDPLVPLGSFFGATMNFDKENALHNLKLGREAVDRAISKGLHA
jgi:predicted acylesterase/phospholipase RssA